MTVTQILKVVHGLMNTVKVVMDGKQSFSDGEVRSIELW